MGSAALYNCLSAGLERTDKVLQRNNSCKQRDVQDQTISTWQVEKLALNNMLSSQALDAPQP